MPGFEFFGDEERKEVNEVLETGILMRYGFDGVRNGIWKARELEAGICEKFGIAHAHLTSSGTSAVTTALVALGIGAGDEVIMPCFTFVASFEAVMASGAIPVMVEINDTLTLDPLAVKAAITPATKCIMPVHMCGSMAELDEIKIIAEENNLLILEDACQAIGGTYKGKYLGTIGHAGTFSFDFVKIITCGEGGVVMTNNREVHTKCDGYTDHGHDHLGIDRGADLHPFIGYNYRISELHAAVGVAQLRKLGKFLEIQKKNHRLLKEILASIPGIGFRRVPDPEGDSCSFISWFLPDEQTAAAVIEQMTEDGILPGNFYWYNNNWHYIRKWDHLKKVSTLNPQSASLENALKSIPTFPLSDIIMSRCISTAISLTWTEEQIIRKGRSIVKAVETAMKKLPVSII